MELTCKRGRQTTNASLSVKHKAEKSGEVKVQRGEEGRGDNCAGPEYRDRLSNVWSGLSRQ